MKIVKKLIEFPDKFRIKVDRLDDGSTIVDAGINTEGSFEAGRLVGEICMGGLGSVHLTLSQIPEIQLPWVTVFTDHPLVSCILSQLAGWSIKVGKFRAMGSGPARALARSEAVFKEYVYKDDHSEAVIVLETSVKPTEKVTGFLAKKCKVDPKDLYVILTPTSSIAGAVQICARIVETGMHKMHTMGVDLTDVMSGHGSCPIPPLSKGGLTMMGRTNDAILDGGTTFYIFGDGQSIIPKMESIPSCSSSDYGRPFKELFKAAGSDFYKLDPGLFSPAVVNVNVVKSGKVISAGRINVEVLKKSFGIP